MVQFNIYQKWINLIKSFKKKYRNINKICSNFLINSAVVKIIYFFTSIIIIWIENIIIHSYSIFKKKMNVLKSKRTYLLANEEVVVLIIQIPLDENQALVYRPVLQHQSTRFDYTSTWDRLLHWIDAISLSTREKKVTQS